MHNSKPNLKPSAGIVAAPGSGGKRGEPPRPPFTHEKRPGPSSEALLILALALVAGLMLGISLINLIPDTGPIATIKVVLLTIGGTLVAYAVNRFAIDKGAPLAAIGFTWVGLMSVAAIVAVGAGMFASTYSGLVLPSVAERRLQEHGTHLSSFVSRQNEASLELARTGPVLRVQEADLRRQVACETASACVSNRAESGRGPVAMALEAQAGRAVAIAAQFDLGHAAAQRLLTAANSAVADYQKQVARTDIDVWRKYNELLTIHGRIEQLSRALAEAIPVGVLRAHVAELSAGITIPGRTEVTKRVNETLSKYADGLTSIMAVRVASDQPLPAFPRTPGVADTFAFIPIFASIAAIVFITECVLPLVLFVWAYQRLAWTIEREKRDPRSGGDDTFDGFKGLIALPPPTQTEKPGTETRRATPPSKGKATDKPPAPRGRPKKDWEPD